ncbi:MAG: hypothetical protein NTX47_03440 [Candidatus Omnitrophica bacterium]|nr:hypothetical protein [Candidatus Omnitrophota bacterium]
MRNVKKVLKLYIIIYGIIFLHGTAYGINMPKGALLRVPLGVATGEFKKTLEKVAIDRLTGKLQRMLKPSGLQAARQRAQKEAGIQSITVLDVLPKSVERYGNQLQKGFDSLSGLTTARTIISPSPDFITDIKAINPDITIVQAHGAEAAIDQEPIFQDMPYSGKIIVLVHRPEEFLLRYKDKGIDALRQKADVIALLDESMLDDYKKLFPDKIIVVIRHGFFDKGYLDGSRLKKDAVVCVGSITTWGEMRDPKDVFELNKALLDKKSGIKFLGYIGGKFDKHVSIQDYKDRKDTWFLGNDEILKAGPFKDELSFRNWLYTSAEGRVIFRTEVFDGIAQPELSKWESHIVDFNIQAYREILSEDNRPKREASGTLHLEGGPAIGVVIDSPAMRDIIRKEGMRMVLMPHLGKGKLDYNKTADEVIKIAKNPNRRRNIIKTNIRAAEKLSMSEIAFAYHLVAQTLLQGPKEGTRKLTRGPDNSL